MEWIKQHKFKILATCGIFVLLAALSLVVFTALAAQSWSDLNQIHYPDTTTFICSSDVVQLGCYPEKKVQSVTVNKTTSTVVYSSDQLPNPTLVSIRLNKTEPRPLKDPYKFQVYHRVNNEPLYTVQTGHITYDFAIQKLDITNNCTLDIFMFDSYFEFAKFLNTGERFRYINRTCLTMNGTEDVLVVNFTLPSLQYIYIASVAIGVNEMNYSTIGGSVTTYDTSKYKQECTDDDASTCSVMIDGTSLNSYDKCVYVGQVLEDSVEDYMFIKAEIAKVKHNIPTVSFTTCASVCFIIFIILVILQATHYKYIYSEITSICASRPITESNNPSNPLLPNGRTISAPQQEEAINNSGKMV